MCDSNISVSCPADFTNYCPASSLCDEGIRPCRRRQRRPKPVSNVKSHIAWFSRKAKGETAYANKPTISFQPRIVPLGEDNGYGGSKSNLSNWSFSSSDEESADSRNKSWIRECSKKSVSREELDAMRGCVRQRRALFSPSPSSSPSRSSTVELPFKSRLRKTSTGHRVHKAKVNEKAFRCNSLPLPHVQQISNGNNHLRQRSLEYDHLENYSYDASKPTRKVIPDSVSVQFGPAGYECKAICETDQSIAERVLSQSKAPFAATTSHISSSTTDVNCSIKKHESDHSCQCCLLQLSHSIPGRLDSSSLDRKHSMERCAVCQCLLCGVSQHVKDPAVSRISQNTTHHQASTCNSWPRRQICSTLNTASPLVGESTIPKKQSVHVLPQTCSPFHSPQQSPHHSPRMLRMRYSKLSASQLKQKEVGEVSSNLGMYKDITELGSTQSVCSCHSHQSVSTTTSSWCDRPHITSNKGVEGSLFKDRSDMMLSWFAEFNDQQRNVLLLQFLEQCNCAQMHFLSVHMEPILHAGCPHNCEDLLSWLPETISTQILSYLDPVSLCQASQVNRAWYRMASQPNLWKALCKVSKWQLSVIGEANQMQRFTLPVQWKPMFAERFRLRRNWLKGYCNVRTFEGHTQGISCIQFDGTRIVSGSWDKTIKVWNRRTNTAWAALTLAGHSGTVRCLHLHGNRLVSGSSDRTIKVWDLSTDKVGWVGAACRATMVGHMHTVRCLQADNEKVISGSYDQTLKVWDIKTGHCRSTLRGHTDAVLCLQFDDVRVVSGSKDTTIKVWSLPGGVCEMTLHGHQAAVTCLQFDESRIVSGALDRFIKIWNRMDGKCIRTIDWIRSEGHTGVVRHLQVDRWKIVSAADDKTLKVWSVHTGDRLLTLKSHTDGVTCLQFSDDVIVSGSYDKTVKLWDFSAC